MSRMHQVEEQGRAFSQKAGDTVQEHPDEAVLVALAAGAIIGLVIGTMLAGPEETQTRRARRAAESLGERLMTSIERMLPDSLSSSLGMK
jgi:hypothetical protein